MKLREMREAVGLSQDEVATRLEISQPLVSYWEKGSVSPTIEYAKELSKLYDVDVEDIITDNSKNTIPIRRRRIKALQWVSKNLNMKKPLALVDKSVLDDLDNLENLYYLLCARLSGRFRVCPACSSKKVAQFKAYNCGFSYRAGSSTVVKKITISRCGNCGYSEVSEEL